jgi:hypothetical protein
MAVGLTAGGISMPGEKVAFLVRGAQPVADPGFRQDVLWLLGVGLDLLAELADVDAQILGVGELIASISSMRFFTGIVSRCPPDCRWLHERALCAAFRSGREVPAHSGNRRRPISPRVDLRETSFAAGLFPALRRSEDGHGHWGPPVNPFADRCKSCSR